MAEWEACIGQDLALPLAAQPRDIPPPHGETAEASSAELRAEFLAGTAAGVAAGFALGFF